MNIVTLYAAIKYYNRHILTANMYETTIDYK
jgi:hypothetical protein